MPSYPLPTLAAVISSTGISAPQYSDILNSLKASFQAIYGVDAYLEPDSQDGQLLAVFAQAIHDCNQATIAAYLSFSPNTAQGVGLSSVVKINHLRRFIPSKSQVPLTLTGVVGTTISNGVARDNNGNRWVLPASVTIPPDGEIVVTAESEAEGAVSAPINSINTIETPFVGWQTVNNASPASLGNPVETDADLRRRQTYSPPLYSRSTMEGLVSALRSLTGVDYVMPYENDTNATDANGLPAHSISLVVEGGDSVQIAQTILNRKGIGVATHGNTLQEVPDVSGTLRSIKYSVPQQVAISVVVTIKADVGYTTIVADAIKQSVADYINALHIGQHLLIVRLYIPAQLTPETGGDTFELDEVRAGIYGGVIGTADVSIAYNARATCIPANVTVSLIV